MGRSSTYKVRSWARTRVRLPAPSESGHLGTVTIGQQKLSMALLRKQEARHEHGLHVALAADAQLALGRRLMPRPARPRPSGARAAGTMPCPPLRHVTSRLPSGPRIARAGQPASLTIVSRRLPSTQRALPLASISVYVASCSSVMAIADSLSTLSKSKYQ